MISVQIRVENPNDSMSITMEIRPNEKDTRYQIPNTGQFTQATKSCLHFFNYRGKEPPYNVEATILRFIFPIRQNQTAAANNRWNKCCFFQS